MQQTWVRALKWDDFAPKDVQEVWTERRSDLPSIHDITFPRPVVSGTINYFQLNFFSVASERAYAAVVYSRAIDKLGQISTSLLSYKTRVAHVKTVSIPRLELCGADLATTVKILSVVHKDLSLRMD